MFADRDGEKLCSKSPVATTSNNSEPVSTTVERELRYYEQLPREIEKQTDVFSTFMNDAG
jgi:hypothetical protein